MDETFANAARDDDKPLAISPSLEALPAHEYSSIETPAFHKAVIYKS